MVNRLSRHQVVLRRLVRRAPWPEVKAILLRVAGARRDDVGPAGLAAISSRDDVVECQFAPQVLLAAVLTTKAIAQEDVEPGEGNPRRRPHVLAQRDDRRQTHCDRRAPDDLVIFSDLATTRVIDVR